MIASLPANGSLTLNSTPVSAGDEIAFADINSLAYQPVADINGADADSFTFQLRDAGGTANGGVDLDPTPNTLTFDINAVNDAPSGTNITLTINEDNAHSFVPAEFGFVDVNEGDGFQSVVIASLPANGSLTLNTTAVSAGDEIAVVDITDLAYQPLADINGANADSFTFQLRDDGGIANGGIDLDPNPDTFTIDITAVNDAPQVDLDIDDSSTCLLYTSDAADE